MTVCAERPRMQRKKSLLSNEARGLIAAFAETWLLSKKRGPVSFLMVQSQTGQVEAVPRHVEISDHLAKKICRGLSVPASGN